MSNESDHNPSRRNFIKKLAYVPPAVLTFGVTPSYATTGSPRSIKDGEHSNHTRRRGRRGWLHRFLASFGL